MDGGGGPEHWRLVSAPYTLVIETSRAPRPLTPNFTKTLDPRPETLNPKAPKPETLNPKALKRGEAYTRDDSGPLWECRQDIDRPGGIQRRLIIEA